MILVEEPKERIWTENVWTALIIAAIILIVVILAFVGWPRDYSNTGKQDKEISQVITCQTEGVICKFSYHETVDLESFNSDLSTDDVCVMDDGWRCK